jgi:hypothetical protein
MLNQQTKPMGKYNTTFWHFRILMPTVGFKPKNLGSWAEYSTIVLPPLTMI